MDEFINKHNALASLEEELDKLRDGAETLQEFASSARDALDAFVAFRKQHETSIHNLDQKSELLSAAASDVKQENSALIGSLQTVNERFSTVVNNFETSEVVTLLQGVHKELVDFGLDEANAQLRRLNRILEQQRQQWDDLQDALTVQRSQSEQSNKRTEELSTAVAKLHDDIKDMRMKLSADLKELGAEHTTFYRDWLGKQKLFTYPRVMYLLIGLIIIGLVLVGILQMRL